jgi:uncharacterized membrane protein SpoIIM required for sporulation
MRQEAFRAAGAERWRQIQGILDRLGKGERDSEGCFPQLYRELCQDLAIARDRHFDALLVERLNRLAVQGHQQLYLTPPASLARIVRFFRVVLPRSFRAELVTLGLAAGLFFGAAISLALLLQRDPSLVYAVFAPDRVSELERMYDPVSPTFLRPITGESRLAMFGYYVMNNLNVCLRTFAGGMLCGIGSLAILLYNGVVFGAVAGHVLRLGFGDTFWRFLSGHAAPELLAMLLSGVAGLRLGWALVAAGRYTRGIALRQAARRALPLVYGSVALLVAAAGIEAFWSPYPLPAAAKYAVGLALAALLAGYLSLSGARRGT